MNGALPRAASLDSGVPVEHRSAGGDDGTIGDVTADSRRAGDITAAVPSLGTFADSPTAQGAPATASPEAPAQLEDAEQNGKRRISAAFGDSRAGVRRMSFGGRLSGSPESLMRPSFSTAPQADTPTQVLGLFLTCTHIQCLFARALCVELSCSCIKSAGGHALQQLQDKHTRNSSLANRKIHCRI